MRVIALKCVHGEFVVQGIRILPMVLVEVIIPKLNKSKRIKFIIDTGATVTLISYYNAQFLGLLNLKKSMNIEKAGGRVDSEYQIKDALTFRFIDLEDENNLIEKQVKGVIIPKGRPRNRRADNVSYNLLGWDVLREFSITINFPKQ